jgi:hypothetical protein
MNFVRDFANGANGKRSALRQLACATVGAFIALIALLAVIFTAAIWMTQPAPARPGPQWADEPRAIREWFQSLMQPDNPYMSCCGEADAFEADSFEQNAAGQWVAIITDGKGVIPNGTRIAIPDAKIKWDKGNPTGHGIVFIGSSGQIYCYVTPGGV